MFIHAWFILGSEFTVLWHDLNLNNQKYLQRNITNAFHLQCVNLIIFSHINNVENKVTLKEILSHLATQSKHHTRRCTQQHRQIPNRISGPCGIILLRAEEPFPLKYNWIIQTWKRVILNITLFELNIPFDSYNCSANAFLLSESNRGSLNQIARLCGRNQNKIFYSASNIVELMLKVTHMKQRITRILHFRYQSLSKETLPRVALSTKQMLNKHINLHAFHFTTHANGLILFYNTHIMMTFIVTLLSEKESIECDTMIYDGPSSKSPLLKAHVNNEGRLEYTSTLFFMAVYFRHMPTANVPDCLNISDIKRTATSSPINITKPETLSLKFVPSMTNIFNTLLFKVSGFSMNIQLQNLQYIGSTEAACYLGGIIFVSRETNRSFGPLCGEFGMSLLIQKGLTFGSHTVAMVLYSFAESVQVLSVGIRVKREQCIGIINPCELAPGEYKNHTVTSTGRNKVALSVDNRNTGTCFHIQHFFNTLESKDCRCRFTGLSKENVFHAAASMYFNQYQIQGCINCPGAARLLVIVAVNNPMFKIILHGHHTRLTRALDKTITKKDYRMSMPNKTFYFNDSKLLIFESSLNGKFANSVDEAFYISIFAHDNCPISTLRPTRYDRFRSSHNIGSACSLTKFNIKPGHHFMWFNLHPNTQIFFSMFFANPNVCTNNSYVNSVLLDMVCESQHEDCYHFQWNLDENFVNWTIVSTSVKEYKVVVVITQTDAAGSHLKLDAASLSRCSETLQGHIYHNTSIAEENYIQQKMSEATRYCIHSSCYTMCIKESVSWNTACNTCQENNQYLLTINSDLEAKIISDIIESNQHLMVSPILFLNLKKNNQVIIKSYTVPSFSV